MSASRLTTMDDAVSTIRPGDSVAVGLALEHAIPFAVGHELMRQEIGGLTLIGPISDLLFDQLIGAGLVSSVRAAWVGNVSTGSAYRFRDAVESGRLEVEDHSNFSMALALQAAAMGVPYLPTRSLLGTDILSRNPTFVQTESRGDGGPLVLVPAIRPDWAVVHVQRAAPAGLAQLRGNAGIVEPAVAAARRVLITAEEIVEPDELKTDPDRLTVTPEKVAAVVESPLGAHPSPVLGHYERDHEVFLGYADRTETEEGFEEWADEWVHGVRDRDEYRRRLRERPTSDPRSARGAAPSERGDYTDRELMVAAAAREIEDGDVVFVGMRLPLLAYQVAVSTHAPGAVAVFENGVVRDEPAEGLLHTMSDPPNQRGALSTTGLLDVMSRLGRGSIDVGFLGGAEVDRCGNLNTTWVGTRDRSIRLPGSGGACDIAALSGRTVILMPHEARRFVRDVGYVTSPGHEGGEAGRGTPSGGGGPEALITSRATFAFDETGEIFLRSVHPGVDAEELLRDFPWKLRTAADLEGGDVTTTPPPGEEVLSLIRSFDPEGFWTR